MDQLEFHRYSAEIAGAALRHDFGIPLGRIGRNASNIIEYFTYRTRSERGGASVIINLAQRLIDHEAAIHNYLSDFGSQLPRTSFRDIERYYSALNTSVYPMLLDTRLLSHQLERACQKQNEHQLSKYATAIRSGADQALAMYGALTHFIRPTAVSEASFELFPVSEIVRICFQSLNKLDGRGNPPTRFSIDGDAKIEGIRNQLALLFQNLLTNAIKYSRYPRRKTELPSVAVKIDTDNFSYFRQSYPGRFDNYTPLGEWTRIIVQDNGPGVESDEAENIFKLYVTNSQAEIGQPGTGMGLSIAKLIVILHGGLIFVDTDELSFTNFVCLLPSRHRYGISTREIVMKELAR
jgi:signal transduction histidine kinase